MCKKMVHTNINATPSILSKMIILDWQKMKTAVRQKRSELDAIDAPQQVDLLFCKAEVLRGNLQNAVYFYR